MKLLLIIFSFFLFSCVGDYSPTDEKNPVSPEIVETSPSNGAMDVAHDDVISVMFSKPINELTVDSYSFAVTGDDGEVIDGEFTFSDDGTTVLFTPTDGFVESVLYRVALSRTIQDEDGIPLFIDGKDGKYYFEFSTPITIPTVVSTLPQDGASPSAASLESVTISFSEEMDADTIHEGSFFVIAAEGEVSCDDPCLTAVFTFADELKPYTSYDVVLTKDVKDSAGVLIDSGVTFTFTTQE